MRADAFLSPFLSRLGRLYSIPPVRLWYTHEHTLQLTSIWKIHHKGHNVTVDMSWQHSRRSPLSHVEGFLRLRSCMALGQNLVCTVSLWDSNQYILINIYEQFYYPNKNLYCVNQLQPWGAARFIHFHLLSSSNRGLVEEKRQWQQIYFLNTLLDNVQCSSICNLYIYIYLYVYNVKSGANKRIKVK